MLYAAAARRDITPPLGTVLFGYPNRRSAKSVNDRLTVDAIALKQGDTAAILVSATILLFDNERSALLRERIAEKTGVPYENIFLHATHTHSAPETGKIPGWSELNTEYCGDILEPAVLDACALAANALEPVTVGVASGVSDAGVNRRQVLRNGTVALGQNPWGVFDPVMTVISFKGRKGLVANIVHYGTHCTAAGDSSDITRDWAGVMTDRLEAHSGARTMFINGCEGDAGPRLSNGSTAHSLPFIYETGERAAFHAVKIFDTIRDYRDMALRTATGEQRLPYAPLPSLACARQDAERIRAKGRPEAMDELWLSYLDKVIAEHTSGGEIQRARTSRRTLLRVGTAVFIPFEYEMFMSVSLRLREHSPFPHTLCMSNTNGYLSYFPSKDQIPLGGYEIEDRMSAGAYVLADNADDVLVTANLRLLDDMKNKA